MTEFLIVFSVTMLMLTLVSERVANFLKLYLQDKIIYIIWLHRINQKWKWFLKARIRILAEKQPSKKAEKEREYRILTINIIVGAIIAAFLNVNLFQVVEAIFNNLKDGKNFNSPIDNWEFNHIKEYWQGIVFLILFLWLSIITLFKHLYENVTKKHPKPYWLFIYWGLSFILLPLILGVSSNSFSCGDYLNILKHIIGYIGTGLFLSLGSKFWHDFLDLLLKVKNTKQLLNEKQTFTNYHSADAIANLSETSRDRVVEKLYEKYKSKIAKIEGVVSYGINGVFDNRSRLYKKIIEVEFTNSEAQTKLTELKMEGSIEVNHNTFYLNDYMEILFTSALEAVMPDEADSLNNETIYSRDANPVCYAYNDLEPNSFGSFGVIEENGTYYAISNLHVFASSKDLSKINLDKNYKIIDDRKKVTLIIGNNEPIDTKIDEYKFYDNGTKGYDYCQCKIEKRDFEKFNKTIKKEKLEINNDDNMTMFGSISKYKIRFKDSWENTTCRIKYNGFSKELHLYKIQSSISGVNVKKGDSGASIFFPYDKKVFTGLLVAKSSNYAYMQILNF